MTKNKAKAYFNGLVVTFTKVNTVMMSETGMEKCTGLTAAAIRGSG